MAWTVRIKQRESGAWAAIRYYESRAEALECARHGSAGMDGWKSESISDYEWAVFEGPRKVVDWLTDDPRDDPPEPRTRWERLGDDPLSEDA